MTAYTCTVDLTIGDTTPGFVMSWLDGTSSTALPANSMPMLEKGDSIQFVFNGRGLDGCFLYARPLASSEAISPFSITSGGAPLPANGIVNLVANPTVYVVTLNGLWRFSVLGFYFANNTFGLAPFTVPFFVDPDADVGTGNPN